MCLTMPANSSESSSEPTRGSSSLNRPMASTSRPPASDSTPPDETDAPSDEVKVFDDEDERELNPTEKHHQVDILSAIKSSLITDTEQAKSDPRHAFPGPDKFYDPALLMAPYLMNSYAAAAYAANGLANVRSSFLYGDPLSSPPPAHVGAPHVGLRPSLYHLPPAAQYPYSMLGADQLAAWHHQAAMYQQNALRAASPYSLPITSSSLSSPMSRFSPGGLLGHHPGLSPGLGGHPGHPHHLPHHIKPEPGSHYDRKHHSDHHKESSPSKNKKDHIKKPLNAFMLYMKEMRPVVQAECTLKESAAINQILGRRWHALTREAQSKYYDMARAERQTHMAMYPGWSARDNYAKHKKKRRKRDKNRDGGAASMKKCRARFGLDMQDLWCRPCRRKKKCIRVQSYLDGKISENGVSGNTAGGGGSALSTASSGDGPQDKSRHAINNNRSEKPHNGMMHSDDEDDDELDDLDDDHSPTSHQGRNSVESTSEQSLTSPAGFSSLPSIGSPAGSVASPSTPGGYEHMGSIASSASSMLGGGPDPSYWYSRPQGAFKPPAASTAGSMYHSSLQQHAHHFQALQHYQQQLVAGGLLHRPPVGTDPRDSKNPLSVSQLTGNHCSTSSHHPSNPVVPNGPPSDSKRTLLGMT